MQLTDSCQNGYHKFENRHNALSTRIVGAYMRFKRGNWRHILGVASWDKLAT